MGVWGKPGRNSDKNGDPVPTPKKKQNQSFFGAGPVKNSFLILGKKGRRAMGEERQRTPSVMTNTLSTASCLDMHRGSARRIFGSDVPMDAHLIIGSVNFTERSLFSSI